MPLRSVMLGFVFVGSTGSQGPRLFTIHQVVDTNTDYLPKAHTWWVWCWHFLTHLQSCSLVWIILSPEFCAIHFVHLKYAFEKSACLFSPASIVLIYRHMSRTRSFSINSRVRLKKLVVSPWNKKLACWSYSYKVVLGFKVSAFLQQEMLCRFCVGTVFEILGVFKEGYLGLVEFISRTF